MQNRILGLALVLALAACSSGSDEKSSSIPTTVYSPNGEPLSGGPLGRHSCEEATGKWFDRLSAGGKGHISELAFINDAQQQFAAMDIDHNGYIVSEELGRYRAPYLQQTYVQSKDDDRSFFGHKDAGSRVKSNPALSLSDPVMSADTNLDFKVTPEEFMKHAHTVFAQIDTNHDGALDRPEVMAYCHIKQP